MSANIRGLFKSLYTEPIVDTVWSKGFVVLGYDPKRYRKDIFGSWMQRDCYGETNSQFGWEIDHIVPVSRGGSDLLSNLQPLQWQNNRTKCDR